MAHGKNNKAAFFNQPQKPPLPFQKKSLLEIMVDGRESESLISFFSKNQYLANEQLPTDLRKALAEISSIRKRPVICYMANVICANSKAQTAICNADENFFIEMVNNIPQDVTEIDIILVTPGGQIDVVDLFVTILRRRFNDICFILPNQCMSAGTLFCLSGNEIIMGSNAYIGPIDPQAKSNKVEQFFPAQSILTLLKQIQNDGEEQIKQGLKPKWSDIILLKQLEPKEIGTALTASKLSITYASKYLQTYKFSTWNTHSDGRKVENDEKEKRALDIATQLCDHSLWLSHSRRITREMAKDVCRLQIIHSESIENLDRALKRFWAVVNFCFHNTSILKIFLSKEYLIFTQEKQNQNQEKQNQKKSHEKPS